MLKSRRPISSWAVLLLVAASLTDGRAADCDQDGVEDLKAIAAGTADDCNSNGIPDVCEFVPVPFSALNDSLLLDTAPFAVVIEDVTGDGRLDLVVAAERRFANPAEIQVFPNLGGTEFDTGRPFDPGENLNSLTAADLDGDGDIDFATTDDGGVVRVMKNDGAGFFSAPTETLLPAFATSLIASDLDGDGAQDLAAVHPVLGAVSLLLNRSNDEFLLVTRFMTHRNTHGPETPTRQFHLKSRGTKLDSPSSPHVSGQTRRTYKQTTATRYSHLKAHGGEHII